MRHKLFKKLVMGNCEQILPEVVAVLHLLPIPPLHETPEGRAFSLAAELSDGKVASRSLQKIVCRHWSLVPLTLRGLALNLCRAIREDDSGRISEDLLAMLDYVELPQAA